MSKKTEQPFEERLKRLEEISSSLKGPALDLGQAFAQFEEGIQLAKGLEKELEEMDKKVELLINAAAVNSAPETKPDFREGDLFT